MDSECPEVAPRPVLQAITKPTPRRLRSHAKDFFHMAEGQICIPCYKLNGRLFFLGMSPIQFCGTLGNDPNPSACGTAHRAKTNGVLAKRQDFGLWWRHQSL